MRKDEMNEVTFAKAAELSQGKAAQYLRQAHECNADILIVKHSTPYVVLMSYERYLELTKRQVKKGKRL